MHERMIQDIKEKARSSVHLINKNIDMIAELNAEIFVSSQMGLEDGGEKQSIKDVYKEEFIEEIKHKL